MADCYVSSSIGSDAYDGLSGTDDGGGVGPKATLAAAPGVVTTGGSVRLKRDDTWTGEQITLAGGPTPTQESERITFEPYDSGAAPIISPQHNSTIVITSVGAYNAGSDHTPITASGGGFTGHVGETLYFPTGDNGSIIKGSGATDTVVNIVGDFSAAATQTAKFYTTAEQFVNLATRDYITIQNLAFDDGHSIPLGNGPATKFLNNVCTNMRGANGTFIETTATDAATEISGNTINQCVRCVGAIGGSAMQNLTISNNSITDVDGDAIVAHDNVSVKIHGNTCGDVARTRLGSEGHGDAIVVTGSTDCEVYNNKIYDYTQGIYVGANAEQSDTTGLVLWGNHGYVTAGWGGGTMPLIMIDVAFNSGPSKSTADVEIFWNTCGDLGGAQSPVVLKTTGAQGTGEITAVVGRNNAFWTDEATPGAAWSVGAQVTSIDVDYNKYGGWTAYTTGGNDANSTAGIANPFVGYGGKDGSTFDFTIGSGSVLNDSGDPALTTSISSVPASPLDPDGTARTKNSGDIGAYEQVAAGGGVAVQQMSLSRFRRSG